MATLIDITTIIQNIVVTVASGGAFILAIKEINKWRSELLGKSKHEIAKKCFIAGLKYKDVIEMTRSPFVSVSEWQGRERQETEDETETSINNEAYAYSMRFNKVLEAFRDLKLTSYEAEALFGAEVKQHFEKLDEMGRELSVSIRLLFMTKLQRGDSATIKKFEDVVYGGSTSPDRYAEKLDNVVDEYTKYFGALIIR